MNVCKWMILTAVAIVFIPAVVILGGCANWRSKEGQDVLPDTMKVEDVDGVKLAYEEYGSGHPVVLLHGFGASTYSWRQVAVSLSASNKVICVDLMGFGHSEKPSGESYTLDRQASLLKQFLANKNIDSPVLVGHSYGGGVCLSLLNQIRQDPSQRVSGLILVDTICYQQRFPLFIKTLRSPCLRNMAFGLMSPRRSVSNLLKLVYYRDDRITTETVNEYVSRLESKGAREALVSTAKHILPGDMQGFVRSYSDISVPTLIIWGEHDKIVPISLGKKLSADIPGASFTVIDDCGHAPQEELPEQTASVVKAFLGRLELRQK